MAVTIEILATGSRRRRRRMVGTGRRGVGKVAKFTRRWI